MTNLIYAISASLDGYIADENGNFDWTEPSEDAHVFFNDFQRSVGTSLIGRRMYEAMRVWDTFVLDDLPEVQRGFAEAWRATDKVVYSSTLDDVPEPRTRLERTFDPKVIQTMKTKPTATSPSVGPASLPRPSGRVWPTDIYCAWSRRSSVGNPSPPRRNVGRPRSQHDTSFRRRFGPRRLQPPMIKSPPKQAAG